MVACFRYASIDVHSVYLPPHTLIFDYGNQDWIQQESDEVQYLQSLDLKIKIWLCDNSAPNFWLLQVVNRAELLFSEVLNGLSQIGEKRSNAGQLRRQVTELEGMLQKEKLEFEVWSSVLYFIYSFI